MKRQYDFNFRISLSKKQAYEMSKIDPKLHLEYLLSFIGHEAFKPNSYDRCNIARWPFRGMRLRQWERKDHNRSVMPYLRSKLDRQRQMLLHQIPIHQLRKILKESV